MPTSEPLKRLRKIAITSGDPTGIGTEVVAKALYEIGPQKNVVFFVYRDIKQERRQSRYFQLLDRKFLRLTFKAEEAAENFLNQMIRNRTVPKNILIDLALTTSAAQWVLDASQACLAQRMDGLVTGPLSKTLVKNSGFPFMGHTGAFRQLCPKSKMHMAFAGKYFNVLLASDHLSLENMLNFLNKKTVTDAIKSAREFKKLLGSKKKIALLGLNPHAGEEGLIGNFEKKYLSRLPQDIVGPLVPDAAFLKKNCDKYSLFICLYHDQGLIPFKMAHGQDSGVHITMGLPFVRTSVDHGTAFDIYNKNLANHTSMLEAIELNLTLTRGKHV